MDAVEAQARLERMTDSASEPVLSAEDIADLLAISSVVDSAGLGPADAGYTPTWDLNRGAAEGWRRKAGRLATHFDFSTDSQSFHRSQAVDACERMAAQYKRKIAASIPITGQLARADD